MARKPKTSPPDEFETWATPRAEQRATPLEQKHPEVMVQLDRYVELLREGRTERSLRDFDEYARQRFGWSGTYERLQQLVRRRHGTTISKLRSG